MKKKVEEQCSDLKQDGLRMEKTQRNNFLTLRKQDIYEKKFISQLQIGEDKFVSDFK